MMKKPIKIIKNRSDLGAGTRGSDMGIDAMEIAAINVNNHYFNTHEVEDVPTNNGAIYNPIVTPNALRIEHVSKQCQILSDVVKTNLKEGKFPMIISGDHSSGLGTISGIKKAYPDKRLGVIWIDAHADLHSPFTTPSGNTHGMPLAAAIADDNLDCKINEPSDAAKKYWNAMKTFGGDAPQINTEDLVFFGVRDTEEPEDKQIEKHNIKNYHVHEVRYRGLDVCVAETLEKLADCDHIYISFDVDSLDCDMVSYGTGTPVPRGFDPDEAIALINGLLASNKVVSLEFVEVNPLLDKGANKMAETAFYVLNAVAPNLG